MPLDIIENNKGWCVTDGERIIKGPFSKRSYALGSKTRLEMKAAKTPRPCLRCGKTFLSEGAHNRMCDPCREDNTSDYSLMV